MTTNPDALSIAAKATGLRDDQVRRAVEEYRSAATGLEEEPEWTAIMFMSGLDTGMGQYGADGTAVTLQIESWKERGKWHQRRVYVFRDKPFEHFSEARAVELHQAAKPQPYDPSNGEHQR